MTLFLLIFFFGTFVVFNLLRLLVLVQKYHYDRQVFLAIEKEMVVYCEQGIPELCFGTLCDKS